MEGPDEEKAFAAYQKGQYEYALPILSRLADKGDIHALLAVAWMNENGAIDGSSLEKARLLYQKAADAGSIDAVHRLGRLLQNSNDRNGAREAYERGAREGHLPCMSSLGTLLIEQPEELGDMEKGVTWLEAAADGGHLFARRKLIKMESSISTSFSKKMALNYELLFLTVKYFKEYFSNWNSDKIS